MLIKETQGDTLQGAIDGVNQIYLLSFPFTDPSTVNVYVNGRLKVAELDDGYFTFNDNEVRMKEPLLPGDTLEIEYQPESKSGGGALGGRPRISGNTIEPQITGRGEARPRTVANNLEPVIRAQEAPSPRTSGGELKPRIVVPRSC